MNEFRPEEIVRVLHEHGVRYVLIGGLAASLHGAATPTFDVDITPATNDDNMARLSAALDALGARVRVDGVPEGVPFRHDAKSLRELTTLNLVTAYGNLDITNEPTGIALYEDWAVNAIEIAWHDTPVAVAALADVVTSKEAAGRDKDKAQLPLLRSLLARLRRDDA